MYVNVYQYDVRIKTQIKNSFLYVLNKKSKIKKNVKKM